MTEQVSVDCNCACHSLPQKGCSFCSCKYGCIPAKTEINISNEVYQLASTGLTVQVPQEQYERLKRLEEENFTLKTFIKNACYSTAKESFDFEINIDDIVRLKRLDENVKSKIAKLEIEDSPCHDAKVELETLKSLYDENKQKR